MESDVLDDLKGVHYHEALRRLHAWRQPRTYLEICAGRSGTVGLASAKSVLVNVGRPLAEADAQPEVRTLAAYAQMPSADFFAATDPAKLLGGPVEFGFIDGLHVCELVLAEVLALERSGTPDTLIVLHDCLPVEPAIAARRPEPHLVRAPHRRDWWIGDAWRAALFLKRHRPDLVIRALDAAPTGLVCITGCDPARGPGRVDLEAARQEMLGYDLQRIGLAALLRELAVESTDAIAPGADIAGFFRRPAARPAVTATRIAEDLRGAAQHDLLAATLRGVRLQTFRGGVLSFQGGPVLEGDDRLQPLRHFRGHRTLDSFLPPGPALPLLRGEYIYGGPLYFHFGHFMAEMVHRIVPSLRTFGDKRFLFIGDSGHSHSFDTLPGWMRGIFAVLGLSAENVAFLHGDCVAETLHICQQGSCLGREPFPGYLRVLRDFWTARAALSGPPEDTHRKIYVSRSKIEHGGTFLGEGYIDGLFRRAGYHIMHPEQLDFARQVDLYLHAEELVFCEGSSCHGCELLGEAMLGRVMLVGKREISTFSNVLRPRSREFLVQDGNHTVGTLVRSPTTGEPFLHLGLHLLDLPGFFERLRSAGFADLEPDFDLAAYRKAVREDLYRYARHYLGGEAARTAPAEVAALFASFERLLPLSLGRLGVPARDVAVMEA